MICLICRQNELVNGLTSVTLEHGEFVFKILDVPALVCSNCGEAFADEFTARKLLDSAQLLESSGLWIGAKKYKDLEISG